MARLLLFCFPYAGGGASIFHTWANELPQDLEIVAIQMPGVERRFIEPPVTRLSSAVETLADVIYSKLDRPFAFFGHSLGALIGFELARKLRKEDGSEPLHLFVSGKGAPQIPNSDPPIHHLTGTAFLKELHHRYGGIPKVILQNPDVMQELLPGLRASFKMAESYNYRSDDPLDCSVTAFGGLQDYTVHQEDLKAWCHQTKGAFTLHMIPGDHFFIHLERQHLLRILSNEVNKILTGL